MAFTTHNSSAGQSGSRPKDSTSRARHKDLRPRPPFAMQRGWMLRPLLADRFKLVLRHESRRLPVYALVLARPDRQLGPQLRRSSAAECNGAAVAMPTYPRAANPRPLFRAPPKSIDPAMWLRSRWRCRIWF